MKLEPGKKINCKRGHYKLTKFQDGYCEVCSITRKQVNREENRQKKKKLRFWLEALKEKKLKENSDRKREKGIRVKRRREGRGREKPESSRRLGGTRKL